MREGGRNRERKGGIEREREKEREGGVQAKLAALWPTCFARNCARHTGNRAEQDQLHSAHTHRSYHHSELQKVQQGAPAGTDLVVVLLGATSGKHCLMAPGLGVKVTTVSRAQVLGPAVAPLSTGKGISAAVSRALRVFF